MAETSMFQEVSRSVDQWCSQMSIANITVPKFNSCTDVFDFITEYEDATTTLNDEQKAKLLNKSFPPGCHRSWYENELKPLINESKPWKDIKTRIIARFSVHEDRDRHFSRLRELKYDPNGHKMLQDFIDDIVYSYKGAYPGKLDSESCIKYIKSALPPSLQATLSVNPDYCSAKDIDTLKKAAKHYDLSKSLDSTGIKDRQTANEVVSMMKNLMSTFTQQMESAHKSYVNALKDSGANNSAVLGAFQSNYQQGTSKDHRDNRGYSPGRINYQQRRSPSPSYQPRQNQYQYRQSRSPSPGYSGRSPISRSYNRRYNNDTRYDPRVEQSREIERSTTKGEGARAPFKEAFNSSSYYEKFGIPPAPCTECNENMWHWSRHCYKNLN